MTPRPPTSRRAFTLAETVLSMVIVALVCSATLSLTTLLARSVSAESGSSTSDQSIATREALDQVSGDLKMTTSIVEKTASAITITVPDRNNDGAPETIRYAWAGAGFPLTRQVNGGTVTQVLPAASAFALTYLDKTVTTPPPVQSAEQLLYSYDNASAGSRLTLKNTTWAAEYFKPSLPANTASWSITRVKIQADRNNTGIFYSVEVRAVDAALKPTGAALASVTFSSTSLGTTAGWLDLTFPTPAAGLDPTAGYAVIVRGTTSGTGGVDLYYYNASTAATDRAWTTTTTSGSSWATPVSTKTMQFFVYGTCTIQP